jgi:hypothetical protein
VKMELRLSPDRFKELFPNASKSVLEANDQLPNAQPECNEAPALGSAVPGEAQGADRVTVRFTGFRVRPLDPDNFAGSVKDLLDGLRHAHIISGDEPWRIKLETEQERVGSFKEERTELEVIWPEA